MTTPADLPELPPMPPYALHGGYSPDDMRAFYAAGVRDGMERAAAKCDELAAEWVGSGDSDDYPDVAHGMSQCAAAIRAAQHTKQQTE